MPVAFNEKTGQAVRLDTSGAWVPTTVAAHPKSGDRLALDGDQWVSVGKPPVNVAGEIGAVGSGLNRTVAELAGAPVDLINAGLNVFGFGTEKPVLGSEWIKDRQGNVVDVGNKVAGIEGDGRKVIDAEAKTATGRVITRIGQELLGTALPAAAALKIAKPIAGAAPTVKGAVREALVGTGLKDRALMGGLAVTSGAGAGVAREAAPDGELAPIGAAAIGGGAGGALGWKAAERYAPGTGKVGAALAALAGLLAGGTAGASVPNNQQISELTGQLIGGGLGLGAAHLGGSGINLVRPFLSQEAREGAAGAAARANIADPLTMERINQVPDELVQGSPLTSAMAVQDPGLAQLERTLRAENPGKFAALDAERAAAQRASIQGQAPAGPGAEAVRSMAEQEAVRVERQGAANVADAGQTVESRLHALGPGQERAAAGGEIRQELGAARKTAKQAESNLWTQLSDNEDLAVPVSAGRAAATKMLREITPSTKPPTADVSSILEAAAGHGDVVRWRELQDLRSWAKQTSSDLAEAGDAINARRVEAVLRGIDADIAAAAKGGEVPPAAGPAGGGTRPAGSGGPAPAAPAAVFTPDGQRIETEWRLVDLAGPDAPVPSHDSTFKPNPAYPAELQPRDRGRAASEAQVTKIAGELDPERLGHGGVGDGAPIIGPDGVVESGNGRILAIGRAHKNGGKKSAEYRQWLESQGHDTSGMTAPALVRVRTNELSPADRVRFTEGANTGPGLGLSAPEQAAVDAGRLTDDMLGLYRGGAVDDAANVEFARAFVKGSGDAGKLAAANGTLSIEGARRLRGALLHKVFGNDSGLVSALLETGDDNIRSLGKALTDAAPKLAQLKAAIAKGEVPADFDPTAALLDAVRVVQRARKDGVPIGDVLAQSDAFNRISPDAETFLRAAYGDGFKRISSRRAAEALDVYVGDALQQQGGGGLFGAGPGAGDIWEAARRRGAGVADDAVPAGGPPGEAGGVGGGAPPPGGAAPPAGGAGGGGRGGGTVVDDGLVPNFGPDEAAVYRQAREATAERKQTFDTGRPGEVLKKGGYNARGEEGYALPVEEVAGKFFNAGKSSETDLAEFLRAAESKPAAVRALEDYAVGDLRRVAVDESGKLNAKKWAAWMQKHSAALGSFPELRARFANVRAAQETLERVEGEAADAIKAFGKSAPGRFLNADAKKAFAQVLDSADRTAGLRDLVRLARGSPEKLGALRRAVVDEFMKRIENTGAVDAAGNATLSASKTTVFMRDVAEALQKSGLFKREHIEALETIEEDMRRMVYINTAGRAIGSNSYQNFSSGAFLMQFTMGLVSPKNPLLQTLGRPIAYLMRIPDAQVRQILTDAVADPKLMRLLLQKSTPDRMNWVGAAIKRRAIALGIAIPGQATEPERRAG